MIYFEGRAVDQPSPVGTLFIAPLGTPVTAAGRLDRIWHWLRHRRAIGLACEKCWRSVGAVTGWSVRR